MQPTETMTPANGAPGAPPTAQDVLDAAAGLEPKVKLWVVRELLRGVFGERPQREAVLSAASGRPYLYLLPPDVRDSLGLTPEQIARLEARGSVKGGRPFRDVIAELGARARRQG